MLTTFGQRLQRLFGDLLDPVLSFRGGKVVVEEFSRVDSKIGVTGIVIEGDERWRDAASGLKEANSSHWKARSNECDA